MQAPDQQILDRLTVLLRDATDAEDRVYRSREEAVSRVPAIVLVPSNEDVSPISDDLDRADLIVVVSVLVAGDPFDVLAAPICAAVHRLIMTDAQLALLAQARLLGRSWEADGEELPIGAMFVGAYVDALVPDDFTTKGTVAYEAIHRGSWLEVLQGKNFVMQHAWAGWELPTELPEVKI